MERGIRLCERKVLYSSMGDGVVGGHYQVFWRGRGGCILVWCGIRISGDEWVVHTSI